MHYRHLLARLDSMLGHERLFVLLIPVSLLLLLPQPSNAFDSEHAGLVQISNRNITAFNNRNLTIECHVDLRNRSSAAASSHMEAPSFTTNGRIVLTFMTIPRQRMALHQMQSFLHCSDPDRTRCWAEFNMDPACLEDQMNYTYYHNQASYVVETACQVDDVNVCSSRWMAQFPLDCYDLGQINVINGKLTSNSRPCLTVNHQLAHAALSVALHGSIKCLPFKDACLLSDRRHLSCTYKGKLPLSPLHVHE